MPPTTKVKIHTVGVRKMNVNIISFLLLLVTLSPNRSEVKWKSLSCVSLWLHGLYSPRNSPGQNTGVGILSLLQGIFPTQGWNPGLPHCTRVLYQLSHQGSPTQGKPQSITAGQCWGGDCWLRCFRCSVYIKKGIKKIFLSDVWDGYLISS